MGRSLRETLRGRPEVLSTSARLDPSLKPTRETRLRVEKEELTIQFDQPPLPVTSPHPSPLAHVSAVYTIVNPGDAEVSVDFGFPIRRGIYVDPFEMVRRPGVRVTVDGKVQTVSVISNSLIYGIVRRGARAAIERIDRRSPAPPATTPSSPAPRWPAWSGSRPT